MRNFPFSHPKNVNKSPERTEVKASSTLGARDPFNTLVAPGDHKSHSDKLLQGGFTSEFYTLLY